MSAVVRAKVKGGRLVLDEPTDLPEGAEVDLVVVEGDLLDDDERERLHAALDAADDELGAGKGIPGDEVIAALRAGKPSACDVSLSSSRATKAPCGRARTSLSATLRDDVPALNYRALRHSRPSKS